MKMNGYDLFDYYNAETQGVPSLSVEYVDVDAVKKQVYAQTGIRPEPVRKRFRLTMWIAVVTAVALMALGATTVFSATAGYSSLDEFFRSLFVWEAPQSPEKMENLVLAPDVSFDSTNEDVQFSLLGMYGDQNQTMLSFEIRMSGGAELMADQMCPLVEYAIVDEDGTSNVLSYAGQTCTIRADETQQDVYYLNLFIIDSDLQGKMLDVTFRNFYTSQKIQNIFDTMTEMQDAWREAYIAETFGADVLDGLGEGELPPDFSIDAWKAYWDAHNYDQRTEEKYKELYAAAEPALNGTWHAEIPLEFPVAEPITTQYDYGEIQLQTLSAQISHPAKMNGDAQMVTYEITLKDGRKVLMDETAKLQHATEEMVACDVYSEWNEDKTTQTEIICYKEPVEPQQVAEITMTQYEFCWDDNVPEAENGWIVTYEEVIYTAP